MADDSVPDPVGVFEPLVLTLSGEIDIAEADDTIERGDELMRTAVAGQRLIIDLHRVTFIDSSGLNGILRLRRLGEERGVQVALRAVPEQIAGLLRLTGIDQVIPIE